MAVLNYISMPLNARYIGKSKALFLACIELCRMISEDKVLEVYLIGLKILTTCLKPPVCGDDIQPVIINKVLSEFAVILIKKIGEFNTKARDISLHTLMTVFRHQATSLKVLIDACMDICEKERDFIMYGKSIQIPIEKQQPRLIIARLEIIRSALQEFDYKPPFTWSYREPFDLLLVPSLFHPSNEVRSHAIELALMMFQLVGEDVRQLILSIDNLKPGIYEELTVRMNMLEDVAYQNTRGAKGEVLEDIKEEEGEEENAGEEGDEDGKSKKGKDSKSKKKKKGEDLNKSNNSNVTTSKAGNKSAVSGSAAGDKSQNSKSKKSAGGSNASGGTEKGEEEGAGEEEAPGEEEGASKTAKGEVTGEEEDGGTEQVSEIVSQTSKAKSKKSNTSKTAKKSKA